MGKNYKIEGVATLRTQVDDKQQVQVQPIPASVSLDPAGIDLTHALLQIVFAHKLSPYLVTAQSSFAEVQENRKAAHAFLTAHLICDQAGVPWMHLDYEYPDEWLAQYRLQHRNRTLPLVIRIDPRRGLDSCVHMLVPTGLYVPVDFTSLKIRSSETPTPGAQSGLAVKPK